MKSKSKLIRVDLDFANEIRKFAEKNKVKIMQASREFVPIIRNEYSGKKKRREIRTIIENVEF